MLEATAPINSVSTRIEFETAMTSSKLRLNLGCGPIQPEGWINIDGSNRAWLASRLAILDRMLVRLGLFPPTEFNSKTKFVDLRKSLPFRESSIAYIYAGELWEHLEHEIALALAKECYRVLLDKGVLRVCVPDGPSFWARYLQLYEHEMSKPPDEREDRALHVHIKLFFDDICVRPHLFRSSGHYHKWQYDEIQLVSLLRKAGFTLVERQKYRESRIPDIAAVERSDFLIVEAVK